MKNLFKQLGKKVSGKAQAGFTLIELLIAITIFVTFLVVVSNSYLGIIRAQKTANETREMYSELRGFVDFVNGEMRDGNVDYFCYFKPSSIDLNANALARCQGNYELVDGNNLRTISKDGLLASTIAFEKDASTGVGQINVYKFKQDNGTWVPEAGFQSSGGDTTAQGQDFAFSNLQVKDLHFEIYPKQDPSGKIDNTKLNNQLQPMVMMTVEVASKNPSVKFDLKFQTLMTSRTQK